jgi:hypothetical protein
MSSGQLNKVLLLILSFLGQCFNVKEILLRIEQSAQLIIPAGLRLIVVACLQ